MRVNQLAMIARRAGKTAVRPISKVDKGKLDALESNLWPLLAKRDGVLDDQFDRAT
mgnify:CR=1 FL=1